MADTLALVTDTSSGIGRSLAKDHVYFPLNHDEARRRGCELCAWFAKSIDA
jgi:hypothetical protein